MTDLHELAKEIGRDKKELIDFLKTIPGWNDDIECRFWQLFDRVENKSAQYERVCSRLTLTREKG